MSTRRRRSKGARHADWLRLVDVSGPFIGLGVLTETFPQGLDADEPRATARLREGYADWEANRRQRKPDRAVHRAWTMLVLTEFLEYRDGLLAEGQAIPETVKATLPEHRVTLRPDLAVGRPGERPMLLVNVLAPGTRLERPTDEHGLHASPAERMRLLLRGAGIGSGLLTDGDRWMLVHQPKDRTATFATWESDVLVEEPEARRAFRSLLGARRLLGVAADDTLDGLFERSRDDEREVTDQLGVQARRAVEMLVDALDRADREAGGALLADRPLERVYEAVVAVVMRVIFLLAAEGRGLMPEDGPWLESYAVAPIREQLRAVADRDGPELLDRRFDVWPRLLATFRAVHGGVKHPRVHRPGFGGDLFDPERYPFLEGVDGARLRISNRVMLHLLDALQTLEVEVPGGRERRALSFSALGVEQIGHVYEGLLDHEAVRASEPVVGLAGTSKRQPEIALFDLERAHLAGEETLLELLKQQTGRSVPALRRGLQADPDAMRAGRLRVACDNDEQLVKRLLAYLALMRENIFNAPTVYLPGAVYVTASTRRRSTGTHYTPPSLTEPIVRYALEPVVYEGPAEGLLREAWTLKAPAALLALKVCDIAMGSGAFLVAACRYLAARLVEAWAQHPADLPAGASDDPEERELIALRLVAERCLYGVDKNSMAVDIAKVSLWLITLRRDRPFTFVDHALRHGDSLLGLTSERQLLSLSLSPEEARSGLILDAPRQMVHDVLARVRDLRERIEASDAIDLREVEQKRALLLEAEHAMKSLYAVGDLVAGAALAGSPARDPEASRALVEARATEIAMAFRDEGKLDDGLALAEVSEHASQYLESGRVDTQPASKPFHWVLEFPEVFARDDAGFDAIVGNPPFLGGKKVSGELGGAYREYLIEEVADGRRGNADLVAFFFLRAAGLTRPDGSLGLVATNSIGQGDTREVGLDQLAEWWHIYRTIKSQEWPGEAALYVSHVWMYRGSWRGYHIVDDTESQRIDTSLGVASRASGRPLRLRSIHAKAQQGSIILGDAFFLTEGDAQELLLAEPKGGTLVKCSLNGALLSESPSQEPDRWTVDFNGLTETEIERLPASFSEVCQRIYSDRLSRDETAYRGLIHRWWEYWNPRKDLYAMISAQTRVLVAARVAKWWAVSFIPPGYIYTDQVIVFPFEGDAEAAVLSATFHDAWARKYSGSMKFDLRYSPTDCFENFPFPASLDALDGIGERYLSHRKATMLDQDQGLTTIYNRVNEHPEDQHPAIVELRDLRRELDRAVADAYGWQDLPLVHDFLETPLGLRYTIDDATKTEALDRLLELNHARHAEEVARGLHAGKAKGARKRKPKAAVGGERLFGDG